MNSKGKLYIDYVNQENDGGFQVKKELTEDEYIKMLREYSLTLNPSYHSTNNKPTYQTGYNETTNTENDISYTACDIVLYDINGLLCDINEIYHIQQNGIGILIIDIDLNSMDDNFETEFKFWKLNSTNIIKDKSLNQDEIIRLLPPKDLKLEIDGHIFILYHTVLYHSYSPSKYALIIQNIKEL